MLSNDCIIVSTSRVKTSVRIKDCSHLMFLRVCMSGSISLCGSEIFAKKMLKSSELMFGFSFAVSISLTQWVCH